MKRRINLISSSLLAVVLLAIPFLTMAQQQERMRENQEMRKDRMTRLEERIPDLTEDQKESIKSVQLSAMKDLKPMRNELGELEAKYRSLKTADNADMTAINAQIDKISALKAKITKREAKAHQEVRSLLTEDQRINFDMHQERKMKKERHKAHH